TILMLTSDNRVGDAARSRELGMPTYLVKPVRRADLLDSIRSSIGQQESSAPPPPGASSKMPTTPLRILLADDSEDNAFLIRSYLKDSGHTLESAANGEEAVRLQMACRFDLILMDMQMPVL